MEGSQALTDVEQHGMRVDVDYLNKAIKWSGDKIASMEAELRDDDIFLSWRKVFGPRADVTNREQLGKVVFDELGHPVGKCQTCGGERCQDCGGTGENRKKNGSPKTDEDTLDLVDLPFIKKWVSLEKLKKVRSTYLIGVLRETVDGFIHPSFNLHLLITFRSSSSDPNVQNQPIRDPRQAKLIRTAYIPRSDDHVLLEIDYSAQEFKGAACHWSDKAMVAYASDSNLDIHRDMAAECFLLDAVDVSKGARGYAKNQFVFPILYGSYYRSCAAGLWQYTAREGIKTKSDVLLHDVLRKKGIDRLGGKKDEGKGTYVGHIKSVEEKFNKRFPEWSRKKEDWWQKYLKNGFFEMMTGFVCSGIYSKNNVMNYPIQGPSFHLLLWSLIELNKWLKKNKMKTKIICEIHDSILFDAHRKELDDVVYMAKKIMTEAVRKAWKWVIVPLAIEAEMSETNWFEKKTFDISV